MDLILASSSPIRAALLANAGVAVDPMDPGLDEGPLKAGHSGSDAQLATALAEAKALAVSRGNAGAWVLGSDSLVTVDGHRFSKPGDRKQAADHLRLFSGKTMILTSAAALARDGVVDWTHAQVARLHVRPLSERFITDYLDKDWPEVSYCVGVFRLEGPGVQLFEAIEGDHFTILGLPLLAVLAALRDRNLISS